MGHVRYGNDQSAAGRVMTRPFWRATNPSNVDDELAQHIDLLTQRYIADGLPAAEAREKAVARFGELERVRHECRTIAGQMEQTVKRTEYFEGLKQDAAYAFRVL